MRDFVIYLRREPTTDWATRKYAPHLLGRVFDVQAYRDDTATDRAGRWPWHYSKSKPTRRNRFVTLDCVRRRVVWLPDLTA